LNSDSLDRFLSKIEIDDKTGCWVWIAGRFKDGYGQFSCEGEVLAHRVSYLHFIGPIPEGLHVLHNCPSGDNPSCVNPYHLWLGTHRDNMEDKVRKGRQKSRAKLSLEDIDMIKHTYGSKIMQQGELAVVYGISQAQVSRIISGARW
jgi:hypothetical protein